MTSSSVRWPAVVGVDVGALSGGGVVAAGADRDVHAAAAAMGGTRPGACVRDGGRARGCDALGAGGDRLRECFGRGGDAVMHRRRGFERMAGRR